jgi:hypothetical protein
VAPDLWSCAPHSRSVRHDRQPRDRAAHRNQAKTIKRPETTHARLRAWNDAWADRHPEKSRRWAGLNRQEWLETGYRLARQLQAELPDVQVLVLDAKDREVPVLDIPNGQ